MQAVLSDHEMWPGRTGTYPRIWGLIFPGKVTKKFQGQLGPPIVTDLLTPMVFFYRFVNVESRSTWPVTSDFAFIVTRVRGPKCRVGAGKSRAAPADLPGRNP